MTSCVENRTININKKNYFKIIIQHRCVVPNECNYNIYLILKFNCRCNLRLLFFTKIVSFERLVRIIEFFSTGFLL